MKNDVAILKLIDRLVSGDAGFESDSVAMDVLNGRDVSEREKTLGALVSQIYRIVHPLFSKCKHPEWDKELENLLKTPNPTL